MRKTSSDLLDEEVRGGIAESPKGLGRYSRFIGFISDKFSDFLNRYLENTLREFLETLFSALSFTLEIRLFGDKISIKTLNKNAV